MFLPQRLLTPGDPQQLPAGSLVFLASGSHKEAAIAPALRVDWSPTGQEPLRLLYMLAGGDYGPGQAGDLVRVYRQSFGLALLPDGDAEVRLDLALERTMAPPDTFRGGGGVVAISTEGLRVRGVWGRNSPTDRATLYVDPTDWSVKPYTDRGAQVCYLDRWRIVVAAGDLEHVIFEADPSTIASE